MENGLDRKKNSVVAMILEATSLKEAFIKFICLLERWDIYESLDLSFLEEEESKQFEESLQKILSNSEKEILEKYRKFRKERREKFGFEKIEVENKQTKWKRLTTITKTTWKMKTNKQTKLEMIWTRAMTFQISIHYRKIKPAQFRMTKTAWKMRVKNFEPKQIHVIAPF